MLLLIVLDQQGPLMTRATVAIVLSHPIAQACSSESNNHIDLAPGALLFATTTSSQLLMTSISLAMYASRATSLTIGRDSTLTTRYRRTRHLFLE